MLERLNKTVVREFINSKDNQKVLESTLILNQITFKYKLMCDLETAGELTRE